jgi:signal transduction histidine kinase
MAFVEVRMPPGWDGVETVERIWQMYPALQVVICTAYSDYSWREMIGKLSKTDQILILKKPFDNVEVYQLACALTEKWALNHEARLKQEELETRVKLRTAELATSNDLLQQEIAERKRAEKKLQMAYTELRETQNELIQAEKLKVIGGLASGVAHEVKNPLAMILLGVDYLKKKIQPGDEKLSTTLKHMEDAIHRADGIVTGLLNFASLSKLDIARENLNSAVENSLRLVKIQLDKHRIQIISDLGEDIPDVKIDKNRIEQVFVNLFRNAINAMREEGGLTVRTYAKELTEPGNDVGRRRGDLFELGETVVIAEIEDNGPGIPKDILDKIFDPFFTTRRSNGGSGLGLSVVRNIIKMHNGKIEIENRKKGGVKITVIFKVLKKGG